jgi:hypothetical protein
VLHEEEFGRSYYVGKGLDWYYGADGGFELPRGYGDAVLAIAWEVQAAITDTLLGYYAYWPHCPRCDLRVDAVPGPSDQRLWLCDRGDRHFIVEIGKLVSE